MLFDQAQDAYKHVRDCIRGGCAGKPVCATRVFSRIGEEVLPKKDAFAQDSPMEFCALEAPRHISTVDGKLPRIVQFSSVVIRSDDVSSNRCVHPDSITPYHHVTVSSNR